MEVIAATISMFSRTMRLKTIPNANIKIYNKAYQTEQLNIKVIDNDCYFMKNKTADGKPYIYRLYVEDVIVNKYIRTLTNQEHDILIPRSRTAHQFHIMGVIIKYVFAIWAFVILKKNDFEFPFYIINSIKQRYFKPI